MDNWIDNLRRIGLKRYGDENRRILSELLKTVFLPETLLCRKHLLRLLSLLWRP